MTTPVPDAEGPVFGEPVEGELVIGATSILDLVLELIRTTAFVVAAVALVIIAVAVQ